ncbi:formate dehydrogenase accessory sulfurtransferase FdhD [Derxia gummosa]|uniref:Sulfur carrier protein FdhD n=1 Tax=Derxia gummosa DSM 723 TaxID=1121388 RepID=A0A9U5D0M0_9BURK|nr:formate dehydrogenase accessory sulfurtransferase FdhD [Derxia gummosa]
MPDGLDAMVPAGGVASDCNAVGGASAGGGSSALPVGDDRAACVVTGARDEAVPPRCEAVIDATPSRTVTVGGWRGDAAFAGYDTVVEEVPVALEFNGISHAVMLATPADLEDFALGFALTEGIVRDATEVRDIEVEPRCEGIAVKLDIASERFAGLKERRRSMTGRTGCGLCGTESLAHAVRSLPAVASRAVTSRAAIASALNTLPARQPLQRATGGAHAAAWCDTDGRVLLVREDVGRHNALDKLAGALARGGFDADAGFALVTSRASVEMVQKAQALGIGILVAVSAPTALAIDIATRAGICLAGFARGRNLNLYSGAARIRA